jgi:hypothetical protein
MRRKWLPEDHPMLLPLMVINARLTAAMGHGAAAEGLCVRMLGIVRKMLGGDENQLLFAQFLKVREVCVNFYSLLSLSLFHLSVYLSFSLSLSFSLFLSPLSP